jgi:hypothetical protein
MAYGLYAYFENADTSFIMILKEVVIKAVPYTPCSTKGERKYSS